MPEDRDDRRPRAPRGAAWLLAGAGVLGAILLAGTRPGVGVPLTAAALGAGLAVGGAFGRRESAVWGSLALGLATTAAWRDAPWVVAIALLGSFALASIAVAGASRIGEMVAAPGRVLLRTGRAPGFVRRGLAPPSRRRDWRPLLRGGTIALSLLVVFGALFATADRAFAHLASRYLVPDLNVEMLPLRVAVFVSVAVLGGGLLATSPRFAHLGPEWPSLRAVLDLPERAAPLRLRRWEWAAPLTLLNLLFLLFVVLQITVLFGGHDHVLRTAGLTYAEYARQGFFQLIAVGALTLGVVGASNRWADRERRGDRVLHAILLGTLCALTLVVLASALRRLGLYEEAFGLTRARFSATAIAIWLGSMIALVLVLGALRRRAWLPRAALAVTTAGALLFVGLDPDLRIAQRNVERYRETGRIDLPYLATLGADAVPALTGLRPSLASCVLAPIERRLAGPERLGSWNLARARAQAILNTATTVPCARGGIEDGSS